LMPLLGGLVKELDSDPRVASNVCWVSWKRRRLVTFANINKRMFRIFVGFQDFCKRKSLIWQSGHRSPARLRGCMEWVFLQEKIISWGCLVLSGAKMES
jgi:hypothetical protein